MEQLETGTYEILRNRLQASGTELRQRLNVLNTERKQVFGAVDTRLLGTGRITTEYNCVAWDLVPVGGRFIFGYNVVLGLKAEPDLADVFGVYEYHDQEFRPLGLELLADAKFEEEFRNLYRYYKNTQFVKFAVLGPHLFMVFRIGKGASDVKTFKWLMRGDTLTYLDNRSDHEYGFPPQHEFAWQRVTRDMQRGGKHPHISIEDKVFVETTGGDLTIKVENNTATGRGILSEPVDDKDQTLDDSEIYYAVVGNLVLLKIRPYQEQTYRYFIFNYKLKKAQRLNALADACVLLPDGQGLIFPHGFYLQTGDNKLFDNGLRDMLFEKRLASPNGEDFLYVFYNKDSGLYLLLSYNRIAQRVDNPIVCHGYAVFENGELCYFRTDEEPKKHHAVQIWQTPFTGPDFELPVTSDSYLYKLGNKEIVRAMSEVQEVLMLTGKEDSYAGLYVDLIRQTTALTDAYHWLREPAAQDLAAPLDDIRQAATAAVEEFEKVRGIRKSTAQQTQDVFQQATELTDHIRRTAPDDVTGFVQLLGELRAVRGAVVGLKELRYVALPAVEEQATALETLTQEVAGQTVEFLLRDDALAPYEQRVQTISDGVALVAKTVEADERERETTALARELELLIDVVSNLPIPDPTQTTAIIDRISTVYARFNQIRAALKRRRQALAGTEAQAEFTAQLKLLEQALTNYLDLADTPAKCDEYLTKLMVQLEELEGRFPDFDQFLDQLTTRREQVVEAFEARKAALVAARNQRATSLLQSAERLLKAVQTRLARLESVADIGGYFAADLMVEKVRQTARELLELGDPVKADDVQSRLKTLRENAVRQLRDRADLYADGGQTIKFGPYAFTVNTQPLELTVVQRDHALFYHLTGTNFFQPIEDEALLAARPVWDQTVVSESPDVYRAEFLAWRILQAAHHPTPAKPEAGRTAVLSVPELAHLSEAELLAYVQQFMAPRYAEGYLKGVHDHDAARLLTALVRLTRTADLLRYPADTRTAAALFWLRFADPTQRAHWQRQLQGISTLLQVFPDSRQFDALQAELQTAVEQFAHKTALFTPDQVQEAGEFLFHSLLKSDLQQGLSDIPEPVKIKKKDAKNHPTTNNEKQTTNNSFPISQEAADLYRQFRQQLQERRATELFGQSVAALAGQPVAQFELVRQWVASCLTPRPPLLQREGATAAREVVLTTELSQRASGADVNELQSSTMEPQSSGSPSLKERGPGGEATEVALLLLTDSFDAARIVPTPTRETLTGFQGSHPRLEANNEKQTTSNEYHLDFPAFRRRLLRYDQHLVPQFEAFQALKKQRVAEATAALRLESFRPRVLTSFVRNQLIDQVYLPLIGANLAKQMGTAGEGKRTDLMGLLLLISPPGYGKTTLMEYVANRLGLIFMKINGPAIGHAVTSLDPAQAPNAGARQELEKLNLSFEMGDNVMIYVDDIQHCHPEFLQKFISLCDAQRQIEGVYRGRPRTYDFRGRKVAVVMAGNPYTESGDVFQLPDMLANRADIYNLGDILTAGSEAAFRLSYLENALTSHPTLARLATQSPQDVPALLRLAETGSAEGLTFEGNHSPEELNEYVAVLRQLLRLRDVVAKVNAAYIASAAQADAYRTEPPFKLQGSYRNMNKLTEKVRPVMNDQEVTDLLAAHYASEAQTLTSATEANLLKLRELLGWLTPPEAARWEEIKTTYRANLRNSGAGQLLQLLEKLEGITGGLSGIREALKNS
ncbi:DNA repair ATPase [Hymenobacter rubripertinctus]|uniref:AAA family ATPase n=1 Tax=Hymenobacter rubripertinctus TaxID=2029981 RepID=A0A418QKA0_9BACT|nr:DNA repair ATPase [Hymenobacter rubripertinctus]RIY05571.1 AAA family ATPase [Hymenobacter rubripertinctus]